MFNELDSDLGKFEELLNVHSVVLANSALPASADAYRADSDANMALSAVINAAANLTDKYSRYLVDIGWFIDGEFYEFFPGNKRTASPWRVNPTDSAGYEIIRFDEFKLTIEPVDQGGEDGHQKEWIFSYLPDPGADKAKGYLTALTDWIKDFVSLVKRFEILETKYSEQSQGRTM